MDERKAATSLPPAFPMAVPACHAVVGKTLLHYSIAPPLLLIVSSPSPVLHEAHKCFWKLSELPFSSCRIDAAGSLVSRTERLTAWCRARFLHSQSPLHLCPEDMTAICRVPVVRDTSRLGHEQSPFKSRMAPYDPHPIMGVDLMARGKMWVPSDEGVT